MLVTGVFTVEVLGEISDELIGIVFEHYSGFITERAC
jgi:hypothetical protein